MAGDSRREHVSCPVHFFWGGKPVPLTGICMCGHPSSLHTDGGGCAAKFVKGKGEQEQCSCSYFVDKGSKDE